MFRNRSLGLVALLVLLAAITLIFGTAVGSPTDTPTTVDNTAAAKSPSQDHLARVDAQFEQRDAIQLGASGPVISNGTMGNESPDELRRQQIHDRRELLHPSAASWPTFGGGQPY